MRIGLQPEQKKNLEGHKNSDSHSIKNISIFTQFQDTSFCNSYSGSPTKKAIPNRFYSSFNLAFYVPVSELISTRSSSHDEDEQQRPVVPVSPEKFMFQSKRDLP